MSLNKVVMISNVGKILTFAILTVVPLSLISRWQPRNVGIRWQMERWFRNVRSGIIS